MGGPWWYFQTGDNWGKLVDLKAKAGMRFESLQAPLDASGSTFTF